MSYLNTYDLAQASSFRNRLVSAIVSSAGFIMSESMDGLGPQQHAKRHGLAMEVLNAPEHMVQRFIWPVLANTTIAQKGLDTSDGELNFQIATVWDSLAGVTAQDKVIPEA